MTHKGEKVALKLLLFIASLLYANMKASDTELGVSIWDKLDTALESLTEQVDAANGESNESN